MYSPRKYITIILYISYLLHLNMNNRDSPPRRVPTDAVVTPPTPQGSLSTAFGAAYRTLRSLESRGRGLNVEITRACKWRQGKEPKPADYDKILRLLTKKLGPLLLKCQNLRGRLDAHQRTLLELRAEKTAGRLGFPRGGLRRGKWKILAYLWDDLSGMLDEVETELRLLEASANGKLNRISWLVAGED